MRKIWFCLGIAGLMACDEAVRSSREMDVYPAIYPDYVGVTVPVTIAPLNFSSADSTAERIDVVVRGGKGKELHVSGDYASFPLKAWHTLLSENQGDSLSVQVHVKQAGKWVAYRPFPIYVSPYPIDYGLIYRRIAPGYEVYSKMGIYRRDLSTFEETPLVENTLVKGMCVNCHTVNRTDADYLSLHVRGEHGCTLMRRPGQADEYLDTRTDKTLSTFTYPYWHPGGDYIAYSTNNTRQSFHSVRDERVEVLDLASDVLVYRPSDHAVLLCDSLMRPDRFETFPTFSPDGQRLYFCAAATQPIPERYKEIRYDLCAIDFDPANGRFGDKVDTLVHASAMGKSVTFPRPSYDGKHLMFTLADYGNFSIWHREADLWLLDLESGASHPLTEANSPDTESFHNWSANSRWFVFSSRREDGLYTRLYLASIDEQGKVGKPFLLPQENPQAYYDRSIYSFNVPDFIDKPLDIDTKVFERKVTSRERTKVKALP